MLPMSPLSTHQAASSRHTCFPTEMNSYICRQVMKASKGLVNPKLLNQALNKKLKEASEAATA